MTCATVSLFPSSTVLNQDIFLEGVLQGQVSYQSPIYVELQDGVGVPITPTSSTLVGNTLTATLGIPNPNGVALQFPNTSQYTSYRTGDTGWRTQNGFYDYTRPPYPAKIAELDTSLGANQWYRLKTALSVNGVNSTTRFVDLTGTQNWGAVGNANLAVLDKLTGIMFTRNVFGNTGAGWGQAIDDALTYSVTILGNTYSNWYCMSLSEAFAIFGRFARTGTWNDPVSSVPISTGMAGGAFQYLADTTASNGSVANVWGLTGSGLDGVINTNKSTAAGMVHMYVHDARNLIS